MKTYCHRPTHPSILLGSVIRGLSTSFVWLASFGVPILTSPCVVYAHRPIDPATFALTIHLKIVVYKHTITMPLPYVVVFFIVALVIVFIKLIIASIFIIH